MTEQKPLPSFELSGTTWAPLVYSEGRDERPMGLDHLLALVRALPAEETQAVAAAIDWPDERVAFEAVRDGLLERAHDAEARVQALEAELAEERKEREAILEAVWSYMDLDPEHTIACHAESLPVAYRKATEAIDKAKEVGSRRVLESEQKGGR